MKDGLNLVPVTLTPSLVMVSLLWQQTEFLGSKDHPMLLVCLVDEILVQRFSAVDDW